MKNSETNHYREGLPASMSEEPYFFSAERYRDQLRASEQNYRLSKSFEQEAAAASPKPGLPVILRRVGRPGSRPHRPVHRVEAW